MVRYDVLMLRVILEAASALVKAWGAPEDRAALSTPPGDPTPISGPCRRAIIDIEGGGRELLKIKVLPLLRRHGHQENRSALNSGRCTVVLADRIPALMLDT